MTRPRRRARARAGAPVTYETVRELGRALPGVEEGVCYGTPALRVKGKLLVRLREDGDSLVVRTDFLERDLLLRADPAVFYITDHYRDYPWILMRLSAARREQLGELLEHAWRRTAPKRLVEAYDQPA